MRKHRLKRLADQGFMEFPVPIVYKSNAPFEFDNVTSKKPFSKQVQGPSIDRTFRFHSTTGNDLANTEWDLQRTFAKIEDK
jgi:hypothetical protein